MGFAKGFSDGADFTGIADNEKSLKISEVIHKAMIEVGQL
jgi:serine protease inhibitor